MRGKERGVAGCAEDLRITPAYAGKSLLAHGQSRRCGDHPRVCREKYPGSTDPKDRWGSPPRMQGKAHQRLRPRLDTRITPACAGKEPEAAPTSARGGITPAYAGKRIWASSAKTFLRNHPRVCGEKPVVIAVWTAPQGITPACAGKSQLPKGARYDPKDHPRVCGEKLRTDAPFVAGQGSPPRVRGKEREWTTS